MKKIIKNIFCIFTYPFYFIFFSKKYFDKDVFKIGNVESYSWVWRSILFQKILRKNYYVPFPVSHLISISNYRNLVFDNSDINNFQGFGNYYQNFDAKIRIGKGTFIAPNVGIITANHNIKDLKTHTKGEDVIIGENCWIGMNAVILPGVELADKTIVGAGSVVTKSFLETNCTIAGNPAKIIKRNEE
jgi:acetyltransferase-like isoleucine patch superfamily enzyme